MMEEFNKEKLLHSFTRALHKRPVPVEYVDKAVEEILSKLLAKGEREINSRDLGERVMIELKKLDKIAYIRFASVYRSFSDVEELKTPGGGFISRGTDLDGMGVEVCFGIKDREDYKPLMPQSSNEGGQVNRVNERKRYVKRAPPKIVRFGHYGINSNDLDIDNTDIFSAASCTTNCIAPILHVVEEKYGIEKGHLETVHSYTSDQNLLDNMHKKPRRGRSAAINMVITSTGAGKAVTKVIPSLEGKLSANAVRVPTITIANPSLKLQKSFH